MILLTNIASLVVDTAKDCLHVSGQITDTVTKKVFSFRGKATIISGNEKDVTFNSLIREQAAKNEVVMMKVEEGPLKNKMTYHNLWKF
jgi:hypothetical protein